MKGLKLIPTLVLSGGAALLGCGAEEVQDQRAPRPVRQHVVGYAGGEATRTFSGTAETGRIINLSFRGGGVITLLDIRLGQEVARGQLLARLDNVSARLAYEQAVSQQNSAASQMNTARLALNRTTALYEAGTASLSDFENAKNSFRTAEASHQSAERSVEIQQDQLRYGYIYAPEAGTIAAVTAEVNENVGAGQTVAVLNAGNEMEISVGLPESVINRVDTDMAVEITFPALGSASFVGRVTEVAPSVDATTATYPVRVGVAQPANTIRTGMAANVTFDLGDQTQTTPTLIVPANAVGEDAEGRFVFLIEAESTGNTASVRKQHISVGELTTEGFVVESGLTAGQSIATAGLQTLLDGQQVRVQ